MKKNRTSLGLFLAAFLLAPLVACGPDAADALESAAELVRAGETERALELLERVAPEVQDDPDLLASLVALYASLDELPAAVRTVRRGLQLAPDHTRLLERGVSLYTSLGQYDEARDLLLAARAAGVGDEHVALSLGVCYGRLGRLEEAGAEFDRAAAAGAHPEQLDYNRALMLLADGRDREALALLEKVLEGEDPPVSARRELARLLIKLHPSGSEPFDRGMALAWEVLDATPEDWRASEAVGEAYLKAGDFAAASQFFEDALRFGRNPARVETKYVEAMTRLKAEVEAEQQGAGDGDR